MDAPEARYLERDGALLAYQVVGDHGPDIMWIGELAQHFDLAWTDPHFHEIYDRAAAWSRTVYMQSRGFGLNDRIGYTPTLEQHADDVLAVLDAAGIRRVTLVGNMTTCAQAALTAARDPERVAGLVLLKPVPCGPLAPTALEHAWTEETAERYAALWSRAIARWGSGATVDAWDPALGTGFNRRLMAMLERCSATPAAAKRYLEYALHVDYSEVLRAVRVPTRVLHPPTASEPEAAVRHVAELVPGAVFHTLEPTTPGASLGEAFREIFGHVQEMATGGQASWDGDRFLGTVLFTDVVGSTQVLARLGDAGYRDLRARHERQVRLRVEQGGGRLLSVTGDGTFSVFDGPTRAVRCARDICRDATELGIAVRAGVHTGELERAGHDVTGMAVHIGARVGALAGAGEVLVSQTVRDLVNGSGLSLESRGVHELKGVPDEWNVYALVDDDTKPATPAGEASIETIMDRAALRTARTAPWAIRAALRVGNAAQRYRAQARVRASD